jgi:hypothetical protein
MVQRTIAFSLCAVAALALTSAAVKAQEIYVVHGIIGSDIGQPASLPVDIGLDGSCTGLNNVTFSQAASAGTVAPGIYEAQVYLVDGAPCAGPLAVSAEIEVPVTTGVIFVVAHLDQNGVPKLSQFTGTTDDIGTGLAKLQVAHTAAAPSVEVRLKTKGAKAKIEDLRPGEQSFPIQAPAASYDVQVRPEAGGRPVLELDDVAVSGDALSAVFAVGSVGTGSLTAVLVEVTP